MLRSMLMTALLLSGLSAVRADTGLLFHAAFDGGLDAYSLAGAGAPVGDTETPKPEFAPGKFGQALLCGPELPLIRYRTAGNVLPPSGTVSLWVQPVNWTPDDGNFHSFFESGAQSGKTGWLILYKYYQSGWLLLRYADEKDRVGMATAQGYQWKPGEWHHVAGTWSPEAMRIYLDGVMVSQAPAPRVAETLAETFALGDNGWHLPHEDARTLLDEVRVYAYPLSAARIRELASRGELSVGRDAAKDLWHAELRLPQQAAAQEAVFEVIPSAGGAALQTIRGACADGVARGDLPVADLPPGEYRVVARALDAEGKPAGDAEARMTRLAQERLTLGNDQIRVVFDGATGGVIEVDSPRLKLSGRTGSPAPLFSLDTVSFADHARFYPPTAVKAVPSDRAVLKRAAIERVKAGQRLVAEYELPGGVKATLTVDLADGDSAVRMRMRIESPRPLRPSEAVRVPRVTFPMLSGLRLGAEGSDDRLATGMVQGELLQDPGAKLPAERVLQYPGRACVPWQDLHDAAGGLSLIPLADGTCQLEIVSGASQGAVTLGNRWWPLLEPGDSWDSPVVELAVHAGAWHWAADRFREWALKSTPPRKQPDWLDTCDGWLGMGGAQYRFADLPKVLDAANYYGFSYLQLWAQMVLGNAYYCYFYPNPDLGTAQDLKKGIAALHARGGKIGFYSNAICFDAAIDGNEPLRRTLAKYGVKDAPPLPRFYDEVQRHVFVGPGGAFGKGGAAGHSESGYPDGYWAMDPNSPWWQEYLATWIKRWNRDYGADIWYLDSFPVHGYGLGPASYALHLDRPRSLGAGQIGLLKRIRKEFDGPLLYEGVACAAFMPYTNWCLGTELAFGSGTWSRPEIFVYSFGDVYPVFSGSCNVWTGIGNIWTDLEKPRHEDAANLVFLNGERFDTLGLYPLNKESPFGEHVRKLVALRRKVRDVLYRGRFMDIRGISGMPDKVEARIFVRQDPASAVVTVADRRKERGPWELRVDTRAIPWPGGLWKARVLRQDGTEQPVEAAPREGLLSIRVESEGEVCAIRFERRWL